MSEPAETTESRTLPGGSDRRWTAIDTNWTLSLFGTAVGAGILFLPMNAGAGGLWTLIVVTALVLPMTYLSHRALSRFVCASRHPDSDITVVAREYFGDTAGKIVGVLYFLSIYPIVLIYGVGITNAIDSTIVNQLGMPSPPRWLLSGVLIALLTAVMVAGERVTMLVTQIIVWPLAFIVMGVSLLLIPEWNLEGQTAVQPPLEMGATVWLTIPVLVFAFSHAAAISQFSVALQRDYGPALAPRKASKILLVVAVALVVFTMTFVFSCTFALGQDGLRAASASNLPVLSYLANVMQSPLISFAGPAIAIAAITSSYFGHYMGASEGARSIARMFLGDARVDAVSPRAQDWLVATFIFTTTWIVAILNPSILDLIDRLSGPVIASILYLMPMYAIHKVPALEPYRGRWSNVFVTIAGLVAVTGIFFGFLN